MTNKRHPKGRQITNALSDQLHEMNQLLMSLELTELDAVSSDLDALSETNSGWLVYRHRNALKEMVAEAISEKDRVRRTARARMGMNAER